MGLEAAQRTAEEVLHSIIPAATNEGTCLEIIMANFG